MNRYKVPAGLLYTKTHEWAKLSGDVVIVGITDYAQKSLHEVVYIDLPEKGVSIRAGEAFMSVESVKAVSEIYAPISGEIVEINEVLAMHPERVNEDPYGAGWLVKLKPENWEVESMSLLNDKQYLSFLEKEANQ